MHKLKHILEFSLFENFNFVTQNFRELFKRLEDEGLSNENAQELWKKIYSVRQALKTQYVTSSQTREQQIQNAKNIEEVLDVLARVELVSRAIKWHKLVPSKYRKELKNRIEEFADKIADYTDYEDYKNNFLPPIAAALHDVDTFFDLLDNHIKGLSGTYNTIVKEINAQSGIEIETLLKEQIIAWVYDQQASCNLGTSSWCIARMSSYFDSYVTNEFRKQYFVWDFRYSTTDKKSLNAITLNNDMTIYHAAWKNNVNNSEAEQQFPNELWYKYLKPLTSEQTRKWVVSLKDKKISNPKTAILIAAELEEFETFSSLLKQHIKDFKVDFISRILDITKNSAKMLNIIKEVSNSVTNYKIVLFLAVHFNDLNMFKNVFKSTKQYDNYDEVFISNIAQTLVRNNNFEMIKVIGENQPKLLTAHGGKPLILAYQLKNAKIFNYLKSKVHPGIIQLLKKLQKSRSLPDLEQFLDAYSKSL